MSRTNSRTFIAIVGLLFGLEPGYPSHHFPEYPVRPAAEYNNRVTKPGLIVAIEPLEERVQQKTYFNSDLSSKGILPVFLLIQNTSTSEAYLFDKAGIGMGEAAGVTGKGARKTAMLLGSGGLVDVMLITQVTDQRENLMKKEVRSKTLSPGSSVSGFVSTFPSRSLRNCGC